MHHMTDIRSKIAGAFKGYHSGAVFRLANGQVWQQRRYKYKYKYKYRPTVRIYREGSRHMMEVDCMDEPIEVVRASIVAEGAIVSDFKGFNGGAQLEFNDGSVWQQAEHKYDYHYAHRPEAIIVDGKDGIVLSVEDIQDTVTVRRIR
jgi:hypothetical protein